MENTNNDKIVKDDTTSGTGNEFGAKVILYNDNLHTYEDVINQVMKAIGCNRERGFYVAHTVDNKGSCEVFKGEIEKALKISAILEEIALNTKIIY